MQPLSRNIHLEPNPEDLIRDVYQNVAMAGGVRMKDAQHLTKWKFASAPAITGTGSVRFLILLLRQPIYSAFNFGPLWAEPQRAEIPGCVEAAITARLISARFCRHN
jgi:hypothetical protein